MLLMGKLLDYFKTTSDVIPDYKDLSYDYYKASVRMSDGTKLNVTVRSFTFVEALMTIESRYAGKGIEILNIKKIISD
jgi:Zn/Cd-binding protein ZinT